MFTNLRKLIEDNDLTDNSDINRNYKILNDIERLLLTVEQARHLSNFDLRAAYSDNKFNQRYRNALQPIPVKQQEWEVEYRQSILPDNLSQVLLEYGIVGELAVIAKMLHNGDQYKAISAVIGRDKDYIYRQVRRLRAIMRDVV